MTNFNLAHFITGLGNYVKVVFSTIVIFALIRVFEFGYLSQFQGLKLETNVLFFSSVNFDSLFIILGSLILLVPMLVLHMLNRKVASFAAYFAASCLILTNVILTQYFLINNSLLTSVVFDFSASTIYDILHSEISANRATLWIWSLTAILISLYLLLRITRKLQLSKTLNAISLVGYAVCIVAGIVNLNHTFKPIHHFESNYDFLIGNSKHIYFIKSYRQKPSARKIAKAEVEQTIKVYQASRSCFNFSSSEFPLLHNEQTPNVLGPFFDTIPTPPNIVLIVSESLSSSYSGEAVGLKHSLTPFTDSLANAGLIWNRFFSNEDRSFAAMPNILASLPAGIGERGFTNMTNKSSSVKNYPNHNSLIQILNSNGYQTNYFYGGWGQFDNTETYLKEIGIDYFLSDEKFDSEKYSKASGGWGYNDKDLFRQSLEILEQQGDSKPFLNVYQTISVHSPFNLSEDDYYDSEFLEKKLNSLALKRADVSQIRDEILSSIFFADDALKLLLDQMSGHPKFDNTIFIITGDHSLNLNLTEHAFENFHIPLIIWSPMLKKTATFNGSCSHLDILPSLLTLLEQNFGLNAPQEKHWIGQGLDTAQTNSYNRFIPLKLSNLEVPNFISGEHVLHAGKVMKLDSALSLIEELDLEQIEQTNALYRSYISVNQHVCSENMISK